MNFLLAISYYGTFAVLLAPPVVGLVWLWRRG